MSSRTTPYKIRSQAQIEADGNEQALFSARMFTNEHADLLDNLHSLGVDYALYALADDETKLIVGAIWVDCLGNVAFAVRPSWRRRGIGTALLRKLTEIVNEKDEKIFLEAMAVDDIAAKMLKSAGFEQGHGRQHDWLYVRPSPSLQFMLDEGGKLLDHLAGNPDAAKLQELLQQAVYSLDPEKPHSEIAKAHVLLARLAKAWDVDLMQAGIQNNEKMRDMCAAIKDE